MPYLNRNMFIFKARDQRILRGSFNKLIKRCNFSINEIRGSSTPTEGKKLEGKDKYDFFFA